MKATLKTLAWRSSALLLIFSMLLSIVKLPLAYGHFTAKTGGSAGLTFLIYQESEIRNTDAFLEMCRPFLFEQDQSENLETFSVMEGDGSLQTGSLREPYPGETVEAEIVVADDLNVEEVFIPSINLHYADKFAFLQAGEIMDAALLVTFDLYEIWNWFRDDLYIPEYVELAVSGEGYKEDGCVYLFTGTTTVQLKGEYDIRDIKIMGPDILFVPPEEILTHKYMLFDQDGSKLTGANWTLVAAAEDVYVDKKTGELTVTEKGAWQTIVLETALESQGRLHTAHKEIQLYPFPKFEIAGAESITVPLPGESTAELYELVVSPDFEVEELYWSVSEDAVGIEVDPEGWVTVSGEARGDSFTLTSLAEILGTPFTVEQEVELQIIQIGSVQVEGEQYITVPDYEPLSTYYTAAVYAPGGEELPSEPVTWHLEPQHLTGIILTGEGELIVEPWATSTGLVLEAISVRDPSMSGSLSVTVEKVEPRTSSPAAPVEEEPLFTINGEDFILIPGAETPKQYQYSVTSTKDFSKGDLTWSLKDKVEGVTVDDSGILTVKGTAPAGTVILLASVHIESEEEKGETEAELLSGSKTVDLAHPAPTSMEISGTPESITIPVPGEDEASTKYFQLSATLLDQKGNPISAELAWQLSGSVSGINLDENGLLSVTSEAQAGSTTVTASAEGISGEVSIELLAPEPEEDDVSPEPEQESPAKEEDDPATKPEEDEDGGAKDDAAAETGDDDGDGEKPAPEPEEDPVATTEPEEEPSAKEEDVPVVKPKDDDDGEGDDADDDAEKSEGDGALPEGKTEDDEDSGDDGNTSDGSAAGGDETGEGAAESGSEEL